MRLIFCTDPLSSNAPDPAFEAEVRMARQLGIDYDLINFETLVSDRHALGTVRHVRSTEQPELAIYRGWMLRPAEYAMLYAALESKGLILINTPEQYRHCHYFPESYHVIEAHTPKSVWLPYDQAFSIERVMHRLAVFCNQPIIIKDYVKSRKHEWNEACYIPDAANRADVERVVKRFLELQGDDLNKGLVFREFVAFQPIGVHAKSAMPLTKEFRCFVLDGQVLMAAQYWDEGEYDKIEVVDSLFADILPHVNSRFFTLDVAQRTDGTWQIVELGDAQVAGLPETLNIAQFYQRLTAQL